MKKNIITTLCIATTLMGFTQSKNFIDQPQLETTAKADSLVEPDRIYLSILIQEKEDRGRTSVEKQEREMASALEELGIDLKKQLKIEDLASNYKKYFLRKFVTCEFSYLGLRFLSLGFSFRNSWHRGGVLTNRGIFPTKVRLTNSGPESS